MCRGPVTARECVRYMARRRGLEMGWKGVGKVLCCALIGWAGDYME
jgi:hypothetical protein